MKRISILFISIAIVAAMVGGGTMALFSDAETSNNNEFTAGTLDLTADRVNDTIPGPMFYTTEDEGQTPDGLPGLNPTGYWKPGDTHHRALQLENIGSIDGCLKHARASLTSGSRHLADKLQVRITTDADGNEVVASATLGQFIDSDQVFNPGPISIYVGDIVNLHFWVTLPSDADNSYQGENLVAGFSVYAEQVVP